MRTGLIVAVGCSSLTVAAQEPSRITLDARSGALTHGFTGVAGVRELPDGRVLVVDPRERSMYVADFSTQRVVPVGRTGQGPLEYSRPMHLLALPDGRTLLQDPGNARFLEVTAEGTLRGVFPLKTSGGADVGLPPRAIGPGSWASDGLGRLYFEPYPREAGTTVEAVIVRLDLRRSAFDTVATYSMPNRTGDFTASSPRANEFVVRVHVWNPRTHWAVAPDGSIAIVEPEPYRVAWVRDGRRTNGPAIRFTPVRVTASDREAYLGGQERPAGAAPRGTPSNPVKREGEPIFPETLPPFTGRDALRTAPDGQLWVARSKNASDPVQTYDVFDRSARLTRRVAFPPGRRLVGFGASAVYAVHRDADDLEYLERYRR